MSYLLQSPAVSEPMQIPARPPPGSSSGPSSRGSGAGLASLVSGRIAFRLWLISSYFSCSGNQVVVTDTVQASPGPADSSGSLQVLLVAEHLGSTVSGDPVMFSGLADLGGENFGESPTSRFFVVAFLATGLFTISRLDLGAVGSGRPLRYRSKVPLSFNLNWLFIPCLRSRWRLCLPPLT